MREPRTCGSSRLRVSCIIHSDAGVKDSRCNCEDTPRIAAVQPCTTRAPATPCGCLHADVALNCFTNPRRFGAKLIGQLHLSHTLLSLEIAVPFRHAASVLAVLVLSFSLARPLLAAEPSQVVEVFHGAVLAVWREADDLSVEQRYERLSKPVRATFDSAEMMRIATGSAWRKADPADRERLAEAFAVYSTSTYADRFTDYNGQSFRTEGERQGAKEQTIVETVLLRADGSTISLAYVLRPVEDGWKVFDVIAEGVSELAVLRSDYRTTLRSGGLAAVTDALTELSNGLLGR